MTIMHAEYWIQKDAERAARCHVLAFLQNPWFKPGTHPNTIQLYRSSATYRAAVLQLSATGRALTKELGDLYDDIWWDNASGDHADSRSGVMPPDPMRMYQMFLRLRPRVVVLLGAQARVGYRAAIGKTSHQHILITRPHPMARGTDILKGLRREIEAALV